MGETKLDLSIPKTQNTIAVTISRYFTVDQLMQIDMQAVQCPAHTNRTKPCRGMEYLIEFPDEGTGSSEFRIDCVLDTAMFPPEHYILLTMAHGNYRTEIKCAVHNMNPAHIGLISAKTLNFLQYRSADDVLYNKRSIINNISSSLASTMGVIPVLIRVRKFFTDIYDAEEYTKRNFYKEMEIDGYFVKISTNLIGVIRIDYGNENEHKFAHLPCTEMGMNMVILIIDKATVSIAESTYIDMD